MQFDNREFLCISDLMGIVGDFPLISPNGVWVRVPTSGVSGLRVIQGSGSGLRVF